MKDKRYVNMNSIYFKPYLKNKWKWNKDISEKQKPREFVSADPYQKKMFKEALQAEREMIPVEKLEVVNIWVSKSAG